MPNQTGNLLLFTNYYCIPVTDSFYSAIPEVEILGLGTDIQYDIITDNVWFLFVDQTVPGTVPIYRFYRGLDPDRGESGDLNGIDHFYSTDPNPPGGYHFEGYIGSAWPGPNPNPEQTIDRFAVYSWYSGEEVDHAYTTGRYPSRGNDFSFEGPVWYSPIPPDGGLPCPGPPPSLSFSQIQNEFTGNNPISIGEYYRGGSYVTPNNTNIPTYPNPISISQFYCSARAYIVTIYFSRSSDWTNVFFLSRSGYPTITITTEVDGGGSVNTYYIPVNVTFLVTAYNYTNNVPITDLRLSGNTMQLEDYTDADYNDLEITPNIGVFFEINSNFYYRIFA